MRPLPQRAWLVTTLAVVLLIGLVRIAQADNGDPIISGQESSATIGHTITKAIGHNVAKTAGSVRIRYPHQSATVPLTPPLLTTTSLVVATVQTNLPGVFVRAAGPDADLDSIRIYLNKPPGTQAHPRTATVAWSLMDPRQTVPAIYTRTRFFNFGGQEVPSAIGVSCDPEDTLLDGTYVFGPYPSRSWVGLPPFIEIIGTAHAFRPDKRQEYQVQFRNLGDQAATLILTAVCVREDPE